MITYDERMIYHVKNFVKSDELKILNDFIDSVEINNCKDVFYFDAEGEEYAGQIVIEDQKIIVKMKELNLLIKSFIKSKYLKDHGFTLSEFKWTRPLELIRWQEGSVLAKHSDGESEPADFPFLKLGALIYLNEDYNGGEILFNDYDIKIKPQSGDLVIFPNNYMHEVLEVLPKGENTRRHTMPTFYYLEVKDEDE
jgi:hypothetical protein